MADKKISQLTALSAANLAPSTDVLAIVDTSATETKKIVAQDLINGVLNVASAVGIGTASPTTVATRNLQVFAGAGASSAVRVTGNNGTGVDLLQAADGDAYLFQRDNKDLIFGTNNTAVGRFTASGNLGLGVTPSVWQTGAKAVEIGGSGYLAFTGSTNGGYLYSNAYLAAGGNTYKATGFAAAYGLGPSGQHQWFIAPSGTINTAISFTQAMTLQASGGLSVGTTTDLGAGNIAIAAGKYLGYSSTAYITPEDNVSGAKIVTPGLIGFHAGGSERGRFTAEGFFKASNTGTYSGSTGTYHELYSNVSNAEAVIITNAAASNPYGPTITFSAAAPNDATRWFLNCGDNVATRAVIRSNGGLANYQSNNVDLSDARTKKDIAPAASMWGKIGALEIVTYKYNDQTHDDVNVGVIAQQVESVEPVWVDADGFGETPEGEEPLKTVYTKDITFAAIKALQEAMARIESLEAKVAALEAK